MTTLFDILLKANDLVDYGYSGVATGGGTTTLVDTAAPQPSDFFNGGTLYIQSGANAGKAMVISDFAAAATWTFATISAVVAGVRYTSYPSKFTKQNLVRAINRALDDIGPITQRDDTLDTVVSQTAYTLPTGAHDVVQVQIASTTAVTSPFGDPLLGWSEYNGTLTLAEGDSPVTAGLAIRLYYNAAHTELVNDTDVVRDVINPMRLAYTAAYYARISEKISLNIDDPQAENDLTRLAAMVHKLASEYPILNMRKPIRFPSWPA